MFRITVLLAVSMTSFGADAGLRDEFFFALKGTDAGFRDKVSKLGSDPANADALFWHGANLMFRSRYWYKTGELLSAERDASEGLRAMQRALAADPRDRDKRALRGLAIIEASREMPAALNDRALREGLKDLEQTLAAHGAAFAARSEHQRGELLFALAEGWARAGDERKAAAYFARLAKQLSGTPYERRAASWLKKRSLTPEHMQCVGCHIQ